MQTINRPSRSETDIKLFVSRTAVRNRGGFTLVELLVVMAIVGTLVIMAMTGFGKFKELARISRAQVEIRGMEREISAWATEKGGLPPTLGDINRQDLLDPWKRNYVYSTTPTRTFSGDEINGDFDLYSTGSDGLTADSIVDDTSKDDIIRGRDGSFVGIAIEY